MSYGFSFEDISKIGYPKKISSEFGYYIDAIIQSEFTLRKIIAKKYFNGKASFGTGTLYIEKGEIVVNEKSLENGHILDLSKSVSEVKVLQDTIGYIFSGNNLEPFSSNACIKVPFDTKVKYWGNIKSIVNSSKMNFAGKKIFMKKGTQSSLEYHIEKKEAYFLQSGELKIGLRVGRAENKSVVLKQGNTFIMNQGVMHMRIALKDSIIFEISTQDCDIDSNIVEDGKIYTHIEV